MINANELRRGNWAFDKKLKIYVRFTSFSALCNVENKNEDYDPIPLTPDILLRCGFAQMPHFTIGNIMDIKLGRSRTLSVSCVGSPNEMVFIIEEEITKVKNIIVARNYDYDGKTYLHHLQNLYTDFTTQELIIDMTNLPV